jgi:hypothetical protein
MSVADLDALGRIVEPHIAQTVPRISVGGVAREQLLVVGSAGC